MYFSLLYYGQNCLLLTWLGQYLLIYDGIHFFREEDDKKLLSQIYQKQFGDDSLSASKNAHQIQLLTLFVE